MPSSIPDEEAVVKAAEHEEVSRLVKVALQRCDGEDKQAAGPETKPTAGTFQRRPSPVLHSVNKPTNGLFFWAEQEENEEKSAAGNAEKSSEEE